jgi:hypothetical protein
MMISVNCGACGKAYSLKPESAGQTFVCQLCNNQITIPCVGSCVESRSVTSYSQEINRRTSYTQEISIERPAYVIFLLDQSGSMIEPIGGGGGKRKDEAVAENLNAWIENMIVYSASAEGVKNYMDVSVIGYCTDENGEAIIEPALGGPLAGRERVSITELVDNVAREEDRTQQIFDDETEEILEIPYSYKVWVEPKANFGAPMCSALLKAYELAEAWIGEHSDSFPPMVINFSGGESTEQAPHGYAESLRSLGTDDGNVLLFNCHMSMEESGEILFPSTAAELPLELDPNAQTLFDISSEFPAEMMNVGRAMGFELLPGARGMAFNADSVGIIKFLPMGSGPLDAWDEPPYGQGDATVATPRTIQTARTIEEINAAARDGFFPLVKLLEPSEEIRSKFSVLQNKTTGEIEVIGDYRSGCGDDFEIVIGFTYVYPHTFTSPFAAYLIPRDLVPGERVLLVDLIEDFVGVSWNQGDAYRLKACEAIWNGDDFDIQSEGTEEVMIG